MSITIDNELIKLTRSLTINCEKTALYAQWLALINDPQDKEAAQLINYDHFGSEIVFLAAADGRQSLWNVLSNHVSWENFAPTEKLQQLVQNDTEISSVGVMSSFSNQNEQSLWVLAAAPAHDRNNEQMKTEVYSLLEHLVHTGLFNPLHTYFSDAYNKHITQRIGLFTWACDIDEWYGLFEQPLTADEEYDFVFAAALKYFQALAFNEFPEGKLETDAPYLLLYSRFFEALEHVDFTKPYPVSPQLREQWDISDTHLPFGVVCVRLMMENEFDFLCKRIVKQHPEIFNQHYNLFISSGFYADVMNEVYSLHDLCESLFDLRPHARKFVLSAAELEEHRVLIPIMALTAYDSIHSILEKDETVPVLNTLFKLFSKLDFADNRYLSNQDKWWKGAWPRAVKWFHPEHQQEVSEFVQQYIQAQEHLRSGDKIERTKAQLMLNTFDANFMNASTAPKRKM